MYSKFLKAMVVATLAAAPLAAQADTAPGAQKGDWIVRVGLSQINPKGENVQPFGGFAGIPVSTLVVDSDLSPTFDVTYMFMEHFGVESAGRVSLHARHRPASGTTAPPSSAWAAWTCCPRR